MADEAMGDPCVPSEARCGCSGKLVAEELDPAMVALGLPGSGKSALLWHRGLDGEINALRRDDVRGTVTFFRHLNG